MTVKWIVLLIVYCHFLNKFIPVVFKRSTMDIIYIVKMTTNLIWKTLQGLTCGIYCDNLCCLVDVCEYINCEMYPYT